MDNKTEKITKKLDISKAFLESNINELYEEIEAQIRFYKSVNGFLQSYINTRRRYLWIGITIIIICIYFFLHFDILFLRILIGGIGLVLISIVFMLIRTATENIKNKQNLINSKELQLEFSQETYWNHMKRNEYFKTGSVYNIKSNMGYIHKGSHSDFVLFPNFAFQYAKSNLLIFVGKSLVNKMSYITNVVEESQSHTYRFKRLEYQSWRYQRKDGGPDRRYNGNELFNYYRYHMMYIGNILIEIESRKYYDDLMSQWSFDVNRKAQITNNTRQNIIITNSQKNTNPIQPIVYNLKDLKSVEDYLKMRNVLYNNYGETIEFEYNERTYIVDNKCKVSNVSLSVKEIVEADL